MVKEFIFQKAQFVNSNISCPISEHMASFRGAVVQGVEHIVSKPEWRGVESCLFYQSGFEFTKTPLLILNH